MEHTVTDLIIRIKNAYMARIEMVDTPHSKFKESVLKRLKDLKYIKDFKKVGHKLAVELRYDELTPSITDVKIISTPGRRIYVSYKDLKPVLGGLGYSLISTPKGILNNKEARKEKTGGELLFHIW